MLFPVPDHTSFNWLIQLLRSKFIWKTISQTVQTKHSCNCKSIYADKKTISFAFQMFGLWFAGRRMLLLQWKQLPDANNVKHDLADQFSWFKVKSKISETVTLQHNRPIGYHFPHHSKSKQLSEHNFNTNSTRSTCFLNVKRNARRLRTYNVGPSALPLF